MSLLITVVLAGGVPDAAGFINTLPLVRSNDRRYDSSYVDMLVTIAAGEPGTSVAVFRVPDILKAAVKAQLERMEA
jgi:hypothetical protein